MIVLNEHNVFQTYIPSTLYSLSHHREEFFNIENKSDLELALEEYIAGGYEFNSEHEKQLQKYVRNSPVSTFRLYRVDNHKDLVVSGYLELPKLTSFTKSYNFWKDTLSNDNDYGLEPMCAFILLPGTHSINIEGYGGFYEQRESLTYGKFNVVKEQRIKNYINEIIPLYTIKQVGF